MARVPTDFEEEFEAKGETFFGIAELLYANPDRQYTQDELADRFECSKQTISNHNRDMTAWLTRYDGQTTYAWDVDVHDPGSTEGITATYQFYTDLYAVFKKHSKTAPGMYAVLGFPLVLAGAVVFAFYIGFSLSITADSAIPLVIYLAIAGGSFITGVIVTLISPFQAWVNRLLWSRIPANPFGKENEEQRS